jgi:hypothetical protein
MRYFSGGYVKTRYLLALLFPLMAGCADEIKDEIPYFKAVSGEAAVEALGSTVAEVIGELGNILGQTGSGINTPSQVTPPDELFEDEEAASAAPGFRPALHEENHLSEWRGPEVGPDGVAGWYYREATDTVWDYFDQKQVVAKWRYWLRFEPAYDVTQGIKGAKPTHTNYAWTSEGGPWLDWKYVIRFGVTKTDVNIDGSVRPKEVEGTWLWEIDNNAKHYRGSRSEGEYAYVLGSPEHMFGDDEDEEEDPNYDPYFGIAVGGSRRVNFAGSGHWEYTGTHADADNKIMGTWYGAGQREVSGDATVTRPSQTTLDAAVTMQYETTGYWGQGQKPANFDGTTPPAFAKAVTPAGTDWGVPKWAAIYNSKLTERDGLLGWWEYKGEINMNQTWDADKVELARDKVKAADEIINDPDADQTARNKAYQDRADAWDEMEDAYSKRDYINRFENKSLTWNGQEDTRKHVSCSDEKLAADCPKQGQQQP